MKNLNINRLSHPEKIWFSVLLFNKIVLWRYTGLQSVETAVLYFLHIRGNRNSQTSLTIDIEFKLVNICLIEIETLQERMN